MEGEEGGVGVPITEASPHRRVCGVGTTGIFSKPEAPSEASGRAKGCVREAVFDLFKMLSLKCVLELFIAAGRGVSPGAMETISRECAAIAVPILA
jgi:hypothetical protein